MFTQLLTLSHQAFKNSNLMLEACLHDKSLDLKVRLDTLKDLAEMAARGVYFKRHRDGVSVPYTGRNCESMLVTCEFDLVNTEGKLVDSEGEWNYMIQFCFLDKHDMSRSVREFIEAYVAVYSYDGLPPAIGRLVTRLSLDVPNIQENSQEPIPRLPAPNLDGDA